MEARRAEWALSFSLSGDVAMGMGSVDAMPPLVFFSRSV
jgi:hypothetical protein